MLERWDYYTTKLQEFRFKGISRDGGRHGKAKAAANGRDQSINNGHSKALFTIPFTHTHASSSFFLA